jgi:arginase family enzyme
MAVPGPPVFDAETREQISSARRTVEYHLHKVFTKTRSNSRSAIEVVEWHDGHPDRDILVTLDDLASRVRDVYLHVDLDAFAPELAPGIADEPVAGGLTLEQAETVIRATADRFRIRAAILATYAPERDREEKTLRVALSLIELLADYASNTQDRQDL